MSVDDRAKSDFDREALKAKAREFKLQHERKKRLYAAALMSALSATMLYPLVKAVLKGEPFGRKSIDAELILERDRLNTQISHLRTELAKLKEQALATRDAVSSIDQQDPGALVVRVASAELTMRQQADRLERLEGALSNDPEKALSLPILRKDLDMYDERFERETASIRSEIDKIDRLTSTLLFTLFSALFVVLTASVGLIIKYVLPGRKEAVGRYDEEDKEKNARA